MLRPTLLTHRANPSRNQGSGSSPCRTPSGAEQEEAKEEITQQEKDDVHNTRRRPSAMRRLSATKSSRAMLSNNNIVHQLIDLALLQNGMLKGASLDAFLKRSVDMIK